VVKPDIGIIYSEYLPNDIFESFGASIESENLNVLVQSKPDGEAFCCPEWYIPAAVVAYIGKSYFDGFLKEMGKDHYQTLKDKLSNLSNDIMSKPRVEPVLFGTEGKISGKNPFSAVLAIHSETIDGYTFKLLVPKATGSLDYSPHIHSFLEFLSDYHLGLKGLSSIGYRTEFTRPPGGYIFVQFNSSTNCIEWLDEADYR
jgi:hypothetical protein